MRKSLAVLAAAAAILSAAPSVAGDHIVAPDAVHARLSEAAAQRAQDLATVQDVLKSPLAQEAAASVGADLDRVRAGVGTRPTPSSAIWRPAPQRCRATPWRARWIGTCACWSWSR